MVYMAKDRPGMECENKKTAPRGAVGDNASGSEVVADKDGGLDKYVVSIPPDEVFADLEFGSDPEAFHCFAKAEFAEIHEHLWLGDKGQFAAGYFGIVPDIDKACEDKCAVGKIETPDSGSLPRSIRLFTFRVFGEFR